MDLRTGVTHLFDKLQRELSGIFLWALQGTLRLRDNRQFGDSDRCAVAARKYRLSCFPILKFLEECTRAARRAIWLRLARRPGSITLPPLQLPASKPVGSETSQKSSS